MVRSFVGQQVSVSVVRGNTTESRRGELEATDSYGIRLALAGSGTPQPIFVPWIAIYEIRLKQDEG